MGQDPLVNLMQIVKEDGIADLPMACKSKFAQAVKEERIQGITTPKAEALFAQALDLEIPTVLK